MHLKAFIEPKFSWGWNGGPTFKTDIEDMVNGHEKRNGAWSQGRHKFKLPFKHISPEMFLSLKAHHGVCRGMLHDFLFHDGMDPSATNDQFGVGNASDDVFQLTKLSVRDGLEYRRNVTALYRPGAGGTAVAVTPIITVDNVPTTAFTVDHDRGRITFDAPPASSAVLRWSGLFSIWVRFDQDDLNFAYDAPNGIYGSAGIIETKPPKVPS